MLNEKYLLVNKNLYKTVIGLLEDYHFDAQFRIVHYKMTLKQDDFVKHQIKRQNERVTLIETVIKNLKELEQKSQE